MSAPALSKSVAIYTSSTEYISGSSLTRPGINGELMSWAMSDMMFNRSPNKLLLDMYRDMGWPVNEEFYSNFGPTFYRNNILISHQGAILAAGAESTAIQMTGSGNTLCYSGGQ